MDDETLAAIHTRLVTVERIVRATCATLPPRQVAVRALDEVRALINDALFAAPPACACPPGRPCSAHDHAPECSHERIGG